MMNPRSGLPRGMGFRSTIVVSFHRVSHHLLNDHHLPSHCTAIFFCADTVVLTGGDYLHHCTLFNVMIHSMRVPHAQCRHAVWVRGADASVPLRAPRAEVEVSLTGALHKLVRQGRGGQSG
jgi:hypothetical protein